MSWWRSKRFSAATTARGAKTLTTAATTLRRVDHRAILGPVVSQFQPRRARAPSSAACASSFFGAPPRSSVCAFSSRARRHARIRVPWAFPPCVVMPPLA
jgi:hypothetical protein